MSSQNMSTTIVKTSLLAGLLGAGIALLLAPRNGNETREKIKHAAKRMSHQTNSHTDNIVDSARENLDEMGNRLENIQEAVRFRKERRQQSPVLTNWEEEV